ncbi:Glycosyl transferase family 2 [Rhodoblastus acidophilus]|uniref:Glycosyl transferase family 2 n=1 Tax=Rhodoblastus acidophilus TaxID=1074 RepID=A0A212PW01_RHOAC|nr:glycosyltransferase family 2 protein [Rhodoblastus acidophilus]PPQ37828.1 hypothetical protein CKO16_12605 [Rhodoblastus acidophilus]RAI16770.1 hypothetical protein CH337_19685 [Rhodoblastus acidophilus]SNB51127.1 Glycosyl transferase family 2 [Rhodoblastus acidophilus]
MPKVAVLMIQKDEADLLEPWILHHGEIFGYDNLYVWDNGSSDPRLAETIELWSDRGVRFFDGARRPERYRDKGRLFADQIRNLERFGHYDFFLPLDCDEFIALKATEGRIETRREAILAAFAALDTGDDLFAVDYNYPNSQCTRNRFFGWDFNKKFVRRDAFVSMDHGGHAIVTHSGRPAAPTDFAYIHYYYRPFAHMRAHARAKLILQPEILQLPEAALRQHRLGRYLVMTEADYLAEFAEMEAKYRAYYAPDLEAFFEKLGRKPPYC